MIKKHCRSSPGHPPAWKTMMTVWNGTGNIVPHVGTAACVRMFRNDNFFLDVSQHCLDIRRSSWSNICYMIAPKVEAEEGERCGYKIKKCRVSIPAFIHSPLFIIHQAIQFCQARACPFHLGFTGLYWFDILVKMGNPYWNQYMDHLLPMAVWESLSLMVWEPYFARISSRGISFLCRFL